MQEHKIRRKDRQISLDDCREILKNGEYGILATADGEGQPYAVPLSYIYLDGQIYFHCALDGHKIENLKTNPRISFVVVGFTEPVCDKGFSTYYESVVIFGSAREVTADDEKRRVLYALSEKYLPDHMDKADGEIDHAFSRTAVWSLEPKIITGKSKRHPSRTVAKG